MEVLFTFVILMMILGIIGGIMLIVFLIMYAYFLLDQRRSENIEVKEKRSSQSYILIKYIGYTVLFLLINGVVCGKIADITIFNPDRY